MKKFSALLNSKWEKTIDGIKGTWIEDNTEYFISTPAQLTDILINLQHNLYNQYQECKEVEKQYNSVQKIYELWDTFDDKK